MGTSMGIGQLGFSNTVFKRKFRYSFEITGICNSNRSIPSAFVKTSGRPEISIDETEINHLHAKKFLPGKPTWETLDVTYYDVASDLTKPLYDWVASVYDFTDPINMFMGSTNNDYSANGILTMYDGCGEALEVWNYYELWPTKINFGDVDYSDSEVSTIDLTFRYTYAEYTPVCPSFTVEPCCTGCE